MTNLIYPESMSTPAPAPPCILVIFGGGGDLAQRKLFPALYNLRKSGLLPNQFAVVGIARKELQLEEYRQRTSRDLQTYISQAEPQDGFDLGIRDWIIERLHYLSGDSTQPQTYGALREILEKIDVQSGTEGNVLFYLATPPSLFTVIPKHLAEFKLLDQENLGDKKRHDPPHQKQAQWKRLIIEKPFGHDWESARQLNQDLLEIANEDQIYRIDHYLGKETVQNMMVVRFANGTYEPIWNRRYIDSVQITVAETVGVEDRGDYYDQSGALRDMVPNHVFQLISLIGMEPPNSFEANDVRDEKVKLLQAVKLFTPEEVLTQAVRGQYEGYQHEPKIRPHSGTETYAAMRLEIDNWRWAGVPFYVRTGKRLRERLTEVVVQFRCAPIHMFRAVEAGPLSSNLLVMQIQPDERIQMRFNAKIPGPQVRLGNVMMDFDYFDSFGSTPQTGYETLLFDCMKGDATLFQRADQVEVGWKIVQPILDVWQSLKPRDFPNYRAGTWGPKLADELLAKEGRQWLAINCRESHRKSRGGIDKKEAA